MEKILVLDFGGQYNQLIARRVRDHGVFAEILPYTTSLDTIRQGNYKGIIFTGGPNSVYDPASPHYTPEVLELGVPVLGICYGCQLMAWMLGGKVETAPVSEYGKIKLTVLGGSVLFVALPKSVDRKINRFFVRGRDIPAERETVRENCRRLKLPKGLLREDEK